MPKPKVLTIIGPTASGKTDLAFYTAISLRDKHNKEVEIISADSRQVYKHIPIATAQPPVEYLKTIKHHFINELEPDEGFNAGDFGAKGRKIIQNLFDKGKIPLIAGGSGLYLTSLIYGLFEIDDVISQSSDKGKQKEIRDELNRRFENEGIDKLLSELNSVDPETVKAMPHVTGRRVIRALEVYYNTGIPISQLRNDKIEINFEADIIGLDWDRKELYKRINLRVNNMLDHGLIKEVEKLKEKGYDYQRYNSLNTVGVKEVFDYLDKKISYERMAELIKQNSRRYAKRQLTWFRRDKNIKWIKVDEQAASNR